MDWKLLKLSAAFRLAPLSRVSASFFLAISAAVKSPSSTSLAATWCRVSIEGKYHKSASGMLPDYFFAKDAAFFIIKVFRSAFPAGRYPTSHLSNEGFQTIASKLLSWSPTELGRIGKSITHHQD